jgi:hypothetical protein
MSKQQTRLDINSAKRKIVHNRNIKIAPKKRKLRVKLIGPAIEN